MKVLKMTLTTTLEIVQPLGDVSEDDAAKLTDDVKADLIEEARKEAQKQAVASDGKLVDFAMLVEIVEV